MTTPSLSAGGLLTRADDVTPTCVSCQAAIRADLVAILGSGAAETGPWYCPTCAALRALDQGSPNGCSFVLDDL